MVGLKEKNVLFYQLEMVKESLVTPTTRRTNQTIYLFTTNIIECTNKFVCVGKYR